jgi:futalosine hydrolase
VSRPTPTGVAPVLVVAATPFELAPLVERLSGADTVDTGWTEAVRGRFAGLAVVAQALGVGKARTAAGLAWSVRAHRPAAILQVGVGGAYLGSFLSIGLAMLADADLELDLGIAGDEGWADFEALRVPLLPARSGERAAPAPAAPDRAVPTDTRWTGLLACASGLPRGRFATLDAVTADVERGAAMQRRFDVAIESMEGAAAAAVAARLGVPFAELRAVSNVVGERDRARWDLRGAVRTATDAAAAALGGVAEDPTWGEIVRDTTENDFMTGW